MFHCEIFVLLWTNFLRKILLTKSSAVGKQKGYQGEISRTMEDLRASLEFSMSNIERTKRQFFEESQATSSLVSSWLSFFYRPFNVTKFVISFFGLRLNNFKYAFWCHLRKSS